MIPPTHFPLLTLMTLASLHAQDPGRAVNMRVDADLVLINALVTDRQGRVITGLDASKFRLWEDGKEQTVRSCVSEDSPVSIGLILDTSGSMSSRLALLKEAAIRFVRAGNEGDEYFVVEFRGRPRVVVPLTGDPARGAVNRWSGVGRQNGTAGCASNGDQSHTAVQQSTEGATAHI